MQTCLAKTDGRFVKEEKVEERKLIRSEMKSDAIPEDEGSSQSYSAEHLSIDFYRTNLQHSSTRFGRESSVVVRSYLSVRGKRWVRSRPMK